MPMKSGGHCYRCCALAMSFSLIADGRGRIVDNQSSYHVAVAATQSLFIVSCLACTIFCRLSFGERCSRYRFGLGSFHATPDVDAFEDWAFRQQPAISHMSLYSRRASVGSLTFLAAVSGQMVDTGFTRRCVAAARGLPLSVARRSSPCLLSPRRCRRRSVAVAAGAGRSPPSPRRGIPTAMRLAGVGGGLRCAVVLALLAQDFDICHLLGGHRRRAYSHHGSHYDAHGVAFAFLAAGVFDGSRLPSAILPEALRGFL